MIFPSSCMELSKLIHDWLYEFVTIHSWISWNYLNHYMDLDMNLSKVLNGFVYVVTWICQLCSMYFSPFAKQSQAEVWPRFQCFLKLLLSTKGVEWVNALGPLCLWHTVRQGVISGVQLSCTETRFGSALRQLNKVYYYAFSKSFMMVVVLLQLIFLNRTKSSSCPDLSSNRPFQELKNITI